MKIYKNIILFGTMIFVLMMMNSCKQAGGNSTGSEYMPDMAHSVAFEANYYNYYYNNTWGSEEDYHKFAKPKLPVNGTRPRYVGIESNQIVPFYYENTEAERTRATVELINNPYPITDKGLSSAKELYEVNCGICHGNKGDGNGWLVDEKNPQALYPSQPPNFLMDDFLNASNGRYYFAIEYGKNVMGSYTDKLSYEERWNVIHYIRSLQAKSKKLKYDQYENTLNTIDRPAGDIVHKVEKTNENHTDVLDNSTMVEEHDHENDHQGHEH